MAELIKRITPDFANISTLDEISYPTRTHRLDLQTKRIVGMTDGLEAMVQAATKNLFTERYAYVIYSANYGVEIEALIGQDYDYIKTDLIRRLKECLLIDDRIIDITDLEMEKIDINSMKIRFNVNTREGVVNIERTVPLTK